MILFEPKKNYENFEIHIFSGNGQSCCLCVNYNMSSIGVVSKPTSSAYLQ